MPRQFSSSNSITAVVLRKTLNSCFVALLAICGSEAKAGDPEKPPPKAVWSSPTATWERTTSSYYVLPRPQHFGERVPAAPQAVIYPMPTKPYAYGWFGAEPRQHFYRSFGVRRAYTEWTLK